MRSYLALILCLMFVVAGCKRDEAHAPVPAAVDAQRLVVTPLLTEPVPLHRVELPGAALPIWREVRSLCPTLLLMAADPQLLPTPLPLRNDVRRLLDAESADVVKQLSDPLRNTDPLLIPASTVDAALRAGFFSQLIWVVPQRDEQQKLSPDLLLEQMKNSGVLDPADVVTLSPQAGELLTGTLRGVAFKAVTLDDLSKISGPTVLHIDLDWFQQGYRTEIATPLLGQFTKTLVLLREKELHAAAATFCAGNLDHRISLDVRFAGDIVQQILEHPSTLNEPPPENWKRLKDILYLQNFIKKEMVNDLAVQMVKTEPNSPWVRFVAYRAAADMRDVNSALEHLAVAVKYDPVYALEYRDLMLKAYEAGDLRGAARMLDLALTALPGYHQMQLERAGLAADMSDHEQAIIIVKELLKRKWSPIYYPEMPALLDELSTRAVNRPNDSVPSPSDRQ